MIVTFGYSKEKWKSFLHRSYLVRMLLYKKNVLWHGVLTQLVECSLRMRDVAGSIPSHSNSLFLAVRYEGINFRVTQKSWSNKHVEFLFRQWTM
jgi:hypothetical protein